MRPGLAVRVICDSSDFAVGVRLVGVLLLGVQSTVIT